MPKQIHKEDKYHKGLNSHSDPRDLEEGSLSSADGVMVDHVGKITIADFQTENTALAKTGVPLQSGFGLFRYASDYKESNLTGGTIYTGNAGAGVASYTVDNGGTGYTTAIVTVAAGEKNNAVDATVEAQVISGVITGTESLNVSSGYTAPPTVAVTPTGRVKDDFDIDGDGGNGYTTATVAGFGTGGGSGAAATATIVDGAIDSIALTNPGSGYTSNPTVQINPQGRIGTNFTFPTVNGVQGGLGYTQNTVDITFSGVGGNTSGAATGNVVNAGAEGYIGSITVTNAGSGYSSPPDVIIPWWTSSPPTREVIKILVTAGGTGYTSAPTVVISDPGGGGTTATATSALGSVPNHHEVVSVTVTSGGSSYTSVPTVSFTPIGGGPGSGAAATAYVTTQATATCDALATDATAAVTRETDATITAVMESSATVMTDIDATFSEDMETWRITNTDDNSEGTVSSHTSTAVTATMSSGVWNAGDGYIIENLILPASATEFLLLQDGRYTHRYDYPSALWYDNVVDLGSSTGNVPAVSFFSFDGGIRISDGDLGLVSGSPKNDTHFLGVVENAYLGGSNAVSLVDELSSILAPNDGVVSSNPPDETTNPSGLVAGDIGLVVRKKTDEGLNWLSFEDSDDFAVAHKNSWSSHSVVTSYIDAGIMTIDPDFDEWTGNNPDHWILSDCTTVKNASGGVTLSLTATSTDGHVYQDVEVQPSQKYRLKIIYTIYAGSGFVARYAVKDLDNDSFITAFNSLATPSGWTTVLKYFTTPANCYNIRIMVGAENGDTSSWAKVDLQANIHPRDGDKLLKNTKTTNSYNYGRMRLTRQDSSGNEAPLDFSNKTVYVDIFYPLESVGIFREMKFRLGTNIGDDTLGDPDGYIYYFHPEDLIVGAWNSVRMTFGDHAEVEGTPTGTSFGQMSVTMGSVSNSDNPVMLLDNIRVADTIEGTWKGKYKFYYSWIYHTEQESIPFAFPAQGGGLTFDNDDLELRVHAGEHASGGFRDGNKRIEGANIYYTEVTDDEVELNPDKLLLARVDMDRGIQVPDGEDYEAWGVNGSFYEAPYSTLHDKFLLIQDTPVLHTHSITAGYDFDDAVKKVRFKTSVVGNSRSYIGNVEVTWERNDRTEKFGDRIYKSLPNKPDLFTKNNFVDVAVNDGDEITALAFYADRLVQFKKRCMYLINVSQDTEYLDDTFKFKGVWGQAAVTETDYGIVWANEFGAYFYDGREVLNLTQSRIDEDDWASHIGTAPAVCYLPKKRHIIFLDDTSSSSAGHCYIYDMKTESWTYHPSLFTSSKGRTNLLQDKDGILIFGQENGANINFYTFTEGKGGSVKTIDVRTRDIDFDNPALRKVVRKVYITYRSNNATNDVSAYFYVNGGSTQKSFASSTLGNTSNVWTLLELVPSTSSDAKNIYSMVLQLSGTAHHTFEINDISVIYREKTVK